MEDPIEFVFEDNQSVLEQREVGLDTLSFHHALKHVLRQDPDIIMVGEIRDLETVEVAVKAALTGHLVLSTLHTNDAPSTISRMVNMGVEPFLITAALNLVVAQRLVRRICRNCKEYYEPTPELLHAIGIDDPNVRFSHGVGCPDCRGTGYRGRVALYELMRMSDNLREMVLAGASPIALKKTAIGEGMRSLRAAGIRKIIDGVTTIEEVISATVADEN
jgi:type IV pilus assembly protein PilB